MIYNMSGGGEHPIHGAYWAGEKEGWIPITWQENGRYRPNGVPHPLDIDWEQTGIEA